MPHVLSCPKGGLFMARNNDAAKEWGALLAQDLNPPCISFEPKINSKTIQGERNGAGARVATGGQDRGGNEDGEGATGKAMVPDESRTDLSVHGFWKWGTSALFDMRIVNLDAGSYLRHKFVKALATVDKEKMKSTSSLAWSVGVL